MEKWNDTDEPIAYLITFRTYGTWLHGDSRGSIDKYHNKFGEPRSVVSQEREVVHQSRLKSPPFLLNAQGRKIVEDAIREVAHFRQWPLIALNVRTNHAHVVIGASAPSGKMLGDLKAYSTRQLRERNIWEFEHSLWVDKGSRRYLWTEEHVSSAVEYVVNGQGGPLPDLD
ncbi:MAG: transposase [Blastocatellia bacterium]